MEKGKLPGEFQKIHENFAVSLDVTTTKALSEFFTIPKGLFYNYL